MTGYNTTTSIFRKGRTKQLKLLEENFELRETVKILNQVNAPKIGVAGVGEFILALSGAPENKCVDEYRYFSYSKIAPKQLIKSKFDLASLPPTSAIASIHSYRVYLQVQQRLENELYPSELIGNAFIPILTFPAASDELLHLVTCRCKVSCQTCECRRAGLNRTAMCAYCKGRSCDNTTYVDMTDYNADEGSELLFVVKEDILNGAVSKRVLETLCHSICTYVT
ncbi:hypothetical protein PR048_021419 [Dryococelus australis]|uniref:Uncharacterized protein n=1 Tax=Dryococelus australis TaxID=614101 RepID=A0ABQ9GY84_9NEOP|nr:hypothetical protein PR048_021419 [Dryococelus australis]